MKKTVKLVVTCLIMFAIGVVTANLSFATENATFDLEKLLQDNNSDSIQQIEEEQTQEQTKTENGNIENENNTKVNEETKTTEESKVTENTQTKTTDDTKLPQTGITENYIIGFCVITLGAIAIFAYKKINNYNIK